MDADRTPGSDRDETEAERDDRLWDDMLQELRVMQTGAQLISGFLLTLPFQQAFGDLSTLERRWYLALVALAALVVALVLTPIAIHRRLAGRHVKGRLVAAAQPVMRVVLLALGLLLVGSTSFVFDVVAGGGAAAVLGGLLGGVLVMLLVGLPRLLVRG